MGVSKMSWAFSKSVLMSASALAVIAAATSAHAGGFALREQSAYYQGMSFAGNGTTGPSISSIFWNPATITGAKDGLTNESHSSFLAPRADVDGTFTPGALTGALGATTSSVSGGDIVSDAWIPSSYAAYKFNDDLFFGLSINAPFGLSTKPELDWAGQFYARTSKVFSINATPTVGYKLNDMFSVGAGLQIQYISVSLKSAYPFSNVRNTAEVKGDDIGFGFTAGATFTPMQGTELALGFRSAIWHDLEGEFTNPGGVNFTPGPTPFAGNSMDIGAKLITPETLTLSAKHSITDDIRVFGTVEWSNWSRLGTVHLTSRNGSTTTSPTGAPDLRFNYEDGWFFALGGEYDWNDKLTLRGGLAYEVSPVTDEVRSARLPDNDRIWTSLGATWKPAENLSLDVGYTHIFGMDTDINISGTHQDFNSNIGTFVGEADASVDILAASVRYTW